MRKQTHKPHKTTFSAQLFCEVINKRKLCGRTLITAMSNAGASTPLFSPLNINNEAAFQSGRKDDSSWRVKSLNGIAVPRSWLGPWR